jgi:DNA-binding MarR family transcriptional regulator
MDSSRHEQTSTRRVAKVSAAPSHGPTEILAERLLQVLSETFRAVRREMRRNAGDLTVPQFRALRFIERHPGTDLSLLAAHLGMSRSSASALVERLNRAGYVHRSTNPDERRRIRIELEPPGALALAHAFASTRDWLATELTTFVPDERHRLADAMDLLARIGEGGHER